jgi:hypothetical protein
LYGYVSDPTGWLDVFGLLKSRYSSPGENGFEVEVKNKTNKREGSRHEYTIGKVLEDVYGKDNVLNERTLYDRNGNEVKFGKKGKETGRRIDYIVFDNNGNPIRLIEVTSKTANKNTQNNKEQMIRSMGGTFIKNKDGQLVDISGIQTEIIRIK